MVDPINQRSTSKPRVKRKNRRYTRSVGKLFWTRRIRAIARKIDEEGKIEFYPNEIVTSSKMQYNQSFHRRVSTGFYNSSLIVNSLSDR